MDQITPSMAHLLGQYRSCFRAEVFDTFSCMTVAWILCMGRHTISRVWEATGRSQHETHVKAFRLFSEAVWDWDKLGRILLAQLLAQFVHV